VISVHRAAARFRTDQPGISTRHSFSSGRHYDPANLGFGPVVACDEHLLDPGAGFARHAHARVELISWVLDGQLRHRGPGTGEHVIGPGQAQYQLAGAGIEHSEVNASDSQPLHFLQLWLTTEEDVPDYDLTRPPLRTTSGAFDVWARATDDRLPDAGMHFVHAATGQWTVAGHELQPGDSVRAVGERVTVDGAGQLLVLAVDH